MARQSDLISYFFDDGLGGGGGDPAIPGLATIGDRGDTNHRATHDERFDMLYEVE
ncbi:hypothetical protein [Williamsia sp. DF01-3]|uniref:hypothetical protein n=1 Tax=Williamsia sp. DF01-3 TaxID=2934157 RepID=UPI001FF3E516|nr:hypothetical protein [Williamsia sp. DF01-3]MCK0516666.1 hypothetical protein [Williamsia sp. DF01-3]